MIAKIASSDWPKSKLGESPHWDPATHLLWWVDIDGAKIHCADTLTGQVRSHAAPDLATFILPLEDSKDRLLVGLADGLYLFSPAKAGFTKLAELPQSDAKFRFNDGKCDPSGKLWAGTMPRDPENKEFDAALYSWHGGSLQRRLGEIGVSNGKGWSPDGKTFYHADTPRRLIQRFAYDMTIGEISSRNDFIELEEKPDGMCVDEAGNLYVACFGAGCVRIFTPEGRPSGRIDVPVENVTACCFGDKDMATLYITTAEGDDGAAGGEVYRCRPGATGLSSSPLAIPL